MNTIVSEANKQERREMIRLLQDTPPAHLAAMGVEDTLRAFHRCAERVPFYRALLDDARIDSAQVTDIASYTRLAPILDKNNTFALHRIRDLCMDGNLDDLRSLLTSSGYSGKFCFGVNTADNLARSSKSTDMGLQYIFDVDNRRTLLINALPMGVKVHTQAAVLAETSVRDDMVYALVKKFAAEFEQIILIGEASFLKMIIEDGHDYHGIDWTALRVHLITGEEGMAENYRTYVGSLLGIGDFDDPDQGIIMSSMGVAELDLNIFHETRETVQIRRLAHADPALRHALFGKGVDVCPMFFIYYPHRCFVEELPAPSEHRELALSMLSEEMKIPLLRYRSGDYGKLFSYHEVVETLARFGHRIAPDLKLPFVAVSGRGQALSIPSGKLYPEEIKEALYADHQIAALLTGAFRLSEQKGQPLVEFQMRKQKIAHAGAADDFRRHLAQYSRIIPEVIFYPYSAFPYGMETDWERKFRYL